MARTELKLVGSDNQLFHKDGRAVNHNGSIVRKWNSDNRRWSNGSGQEIKDLKGKTIIDLEDIF